MELDTMAIGKRIKQRRSQLGLKQTEVRDAVGVSSGNMSDLENGKRLPSAGTLIRLSQVLCCSTDYILTGKSPNEECAALPDIRETKLLQLYRVLSDYDKEEMLAIADLKYQRSKRTPSSP